MITDTKGKTKKKKQNSNNIFEELISVFDKKINLVSAQDILSVANEVFSPSNLSSLTFLPES